MASLFSVVMWFRLVHDRLERVDSCSARSMGRCAGTFDEPSGLNHLASLPQPLFQVAFTVPPMWQLAISVDRRL